MGPLRNLGLVCGRVVVGNRAARERETPARDWRSSVSFFVLSNFAVWAAYDMYPKNFGGLMTSYTLALPFFRHAVEGDLLFTSAFFATPVVLAALAEAFGHGDHAAAA
jgi:hypothetical protein